MSAPSYLEHPLVRAVVAALVDQADRKAYRPNPRAPALCLRDGDVAAWRRAEDASAMEFAWKRLLDLQAIECITLKLSKAAVHAGAPWREDHRIILTPRGEVCFRSWLFRPKPEPSAQREWREAVQSAPDLPDSARAALLLRPLALGRRPAQEVITRLLAASRSLPAGLPRRVASARTFWGHSKILDSRDDLLEVVGGRAPTWRKHPLQILVHNPSARPAALLFVENTEAFEAIQNDVVPLPRDWTTLFSSGFKAGTRRLLEPGGARWFSSLDADAGCSLDMLQVAQRAAAGGCSTFFWGDLDYAGMSILRDLRSVLPHTRAWEPGYSRLLARLFAGESHFASESRKVRQQDPGRTGCPYADDTLLPGLRRAQRFVDQEAVCYAAEWPRNTISLGDEP